MPTLRDLVNEHVREGELYEKIDRDRVRCFACGHCCPIPEGQPGAAGVQAYWGVANAEAEARRLAQLGAATEEPVKDVGGGIKVASFRDPFGNLFSIIENPNFKIEGAP